MIPVAKPFFPPLDEYVEELRGIWEREWITNNGPLVQRLEAELQRHLGVKNVILVSNGTISMQLAMKALGIEEGEVITTPFSFVATTSVVLWERCLPVFADIDPVSLCIDPKRVEALIGPRTKAILATHVYGRPCDHEALSALARKHGLKLIYDAAHAFGVRRGKESILAWGDVSSLSFHATKLFHTAEGGALVTQDDALAEQLRLLRSFGYVGDDFQIAGVNAKVSELQAAMGLCVLRHQSGIREERRRLWDLYDQCLSELGLVSMAPRWDERFENNYAYYPLLFPSEERLLQAKARMERDQVLPRRYFWPSLNKLPYVEAAACPISEDVARRALCLPLWAGAEASGELLPAVKAALRGDQT